MARYRAPSPPKSPYITAQGYQQLQQEDKSLWLKRREVTKALAAAAAEGDRSENAEYIYRKKELREIDRRVRYLQVRLPKLKIINQPPDKQDQVYFAAWVTLEDSDGNEDNYRIVGPDEIDHHESYISIDSPLATSLLKRNVDDQVKIETPGGKLTYWITMVNYEKEK